MTRIKKIATSNLLVEKLSMLKFSKKIILLFCAIALETPFMLLIMQKDFKSQTPIYIFLIGILTTVIAYFFWCILLTFIAKVSFRNLLANLMIIILLVTLFCNLEGFARPIRLTSDYELISTQVAPCGEYSAEAYKVETNSDGTFLGEVYIVYEGYEHGKRRVFQEDNMQELDVAWENDDLLLVNGAKIDIS